MWDAKLNQWIPKTAPKVSLNGTVAPAPVTQAVSTTVTSLGGTTYVITFITPFNVAPAVVATPGAGVLTITATSTTTFTFTLTTLAGAAFGAATVIGVEYIAVGT